MEREILTLRSENFNEDEYKQLLTRLIETDRELAIRFIPQLALRSAMRIAPLLGAAGHLNFWTEEKRITNLAAILTIIALPKKITYKAAAYTAAAYAAAHAHAYAATATAAAATATATAAAAAHAHAHAYPYPDADADAYAYAYAYADDAADAAGVAARIADASYKALKVDVHTVLEAGAEFKVGSLWWGAVPDFFIVNLSKLETIVARLPRSKDDEKDWNTINAGLHILWREAGVARPSSYGATNQSHPENPSATDKLNRQQLVNALAANLIHSTNKHHRAIGLLGEWGSGKSTVLKLLKQRLKELHTEQPFVFGEFNAWAYEHSDNIQAGIAQEVLNAVTSVETYEIPEKHKDEKRVAYLQRSLRPRMLNAFWRPIKSFVLRPWITFWFSLRTQKLQLLKSVLLLFVALLPAMLASQNIDSDWFSWLGKLSSDNKTLLDNLAFQLLWGVGFGIYFLKEIRSLMANPLSKELLTYIRLPDYAKHLGEIPVMRENIKVMCDIRLGRLCGKPKRMLFVVDDLDRCSPAAIVKVLEALRLVLDLENVIVLIAIDQNIALAALSDHFEDFAKHHKLKNSHAIAREYLSKVINLPIVLTAPSGDDVKTFMTDLWKDMPDAPSTDEPNPEPKKPLETDLHGGKGPGESEVEMQGENHSKKITTGGNSQVPIEKGQSETPPEVPASQQDASDRNIIPDKKAVETANSFQALSSGQQQSFIFWVNYFELTNPRQIKRLNNSYDLMRSYFDSWDKDEDRISFPLRNQPNLSVYPMLLTLILMEYLNSLTDLKQRAQLWPQLFDQKPGDKPDVGALDEKKVTPEFIAAYRAIATQKDYEFLAVKVEAFVLPAMVAAAETDKEDKTKLLEQMGLLLKTSVEQMPAA